MIIPYIFHKRCRDHKHTQNCTNSIANHLDSLIFALVSIWDNVSRWFFIALHIILYLFNVCHGGFPYSSHKSQGDLYAIRKMQYSIFLLFGIFRSSNDDTLKWIAQDLTADKSTLVQVISWFRQTVSQYLSQSWCSCYAATVWRAGNVVGSYGITCGPFY